MSGGALVAIGIIPSGPGALIALVFLAAVFGSILLFTRKKK